MSNYPLNYARNARKDRLTIAMAVVLPVLFVAGLVVCLFVSWWMVILLALGLSFLYLSIYALMHEALHGGLHPNPSVNRLLGQWCGLPLLMVFDVVRIAHNMHHSFNRCESQCFDCYYQPQQRWLKNLFWYGILLGGHWVTTILGGLVIAILPFAWTRRLLAPSTYFEQGPPQFVRSQIRIEALIVCAAVGLLCAWVVHIDAPIDRVLWVYGLCAFNWSTRQYIQHAFSPRVTLDGGYNLACGRINQIILLKGNWDKVHHQYPKLPWYDLNHYADGSARPVMWRQYLRQWKGVQLNTEPHPEPMPFVFR